MISRRCDVDEVATEDVVNFMSQSTMEQIIFLTYAGYRILCIHIIIK